MNLSDGGLNQRKEIRDGYFTQNGICAVQKMMMDNGTQKGLKTILTERDLWPKTGLNKDQAALLLSEQPDFKAQKAWLEEVVFASGHLIDFYPKFHCELNFIERVWALLKKILRDECEWSFASLQVKVPEVMR